MASQWLSTPAPEKDEPEVQNGSRGMQVPDYLPVAATGACVAPSGARTGRTEVLLARRRGVSNEVGYDAAGGEQAEKPSDGEGAS